VTTGGEAMHDTDKFLQMLNDLVHLLLSTDDEERYVSLVLEGMGLMGRSLNLDRVQIWKNEEKDGQLYFTHAYEWLSEIGKQKVSVPIGLSFSYSDKSEWESMFLRGEHINAPLSKMSPGDQIFLSTYEIKSIVIIPLFLRDHFWGFLSLDDCLNERILSDEEINVLRSGGMLIANALLHDYKTQDIHTATAKLDAVIENYSGVIWSVNSENIITLFKGLYLKEIGVTHDFLEGKNIEVARQKNRHLDIIESVQKTFAEGPQNWISEIEGKLFNVHTTPICDENGAVVAVVGSVNDVTEALQLQNELEAALEQAATALSDLELAQHTVSAMFETNPHMNILFNSSFEVIDCNPAAFLFMGFDSKEKLLAGFIKRGFFGRPAHI